MSTIGDEHPWYDEECLLYDDKCQNKLTSIEVYVLHFIKLFKKGC